MRTPVCPVSSLRPRRTALSAMHAERSRNVNARLLNRIVNGSDTGAMSAPRVKRSWRIAAAISASAPAMTGRRRHCDPAHASASASMLQYWTSARPLNCIHVAQTTSSIAVRRE